MLQGEVSAADTGVLHSTQHVYADECQVFQNSFTNFFTAKKYYNDKSLQQGYVIAVMCRNVK